MSAPTATHGLFRMTYAELERAAARAFDMGAKSTLLRIAEHKARTLPPTDRYGVMEKRIVDLACAPRSTFISRGNAA